MATKRRRSVKNETDSAEMAAAQDNSGNAQLHLAEPVPMPVTMDIPERAVAPQIDMASTPFMQQDEAAEIQAQPVQVQPAQVQPAQVQPVLAPQREKPASRAASRQVQAEPERLGDVLRHVRRSRRERLDDIAEYLRIRPTFLVALEESRYEDLPADAYVIGFLRTYAVYLGLDGRAAIDQYRKEMSGRRNKPLLTMPQPVSEGPAPTMPLLIASVLAALLLYAIWYAFASTDRAEVSTPPPLPQAVVEDKAEKADSDKSVSLQPVALPATSQPAVPPATTDAPAPVSPAPQTPVGPQTNAAPAAPVPSVAAPQPSAQSQPAEKAEPKVVADEKGITLSLPAPAPVTTNPVSAAPSTPKTQADKPADAKAVEALPEEPKGKTYGAAADKARVAVKAVKSSWILIADEHGNTVFDRTLRPGEVYYVPTGKNLTLTTGNGKGLKLSLDGSDLPTVGADGSVVRALTLDPDKIKSKISE